MEVALTDQGDITVCTIDGNLEYSTVATFRAVVAGLQPKRPVVFDLGGVPFIDSSGIGALIGAVRRTREMGADAVVCSLRPSVWRVLNLVGLPRVVAVVATREEAEERCSAAAVA